VLPEFSLNEFEPTGHERTDKAFEKLKKLFKASRNVLPSVLFGMIVERLELLSYVSADELECLFFALELLRSAEVNGEVTCTADAAAFLNGLTTDNKQERSLRFELAENSVKITNLHKVKGLEANVVKLADPDNNDLPPSIATVRSGCKAETYVFSCCNLAATDKYFRDEYDTESEACIAEKERLIYVAATRARSILLAAKPEGCVNFWSFLADRAEKELEYDVPEKCDKVSDPIKMSDIYAGTDDPFAGVKTSRSYLPWREIIQGSSEQSCLDEI